MANTFAPTGFQFIRNYLNGAPTYQSTWVALAYNNSHTIGKGDVVLQLNTGFIDLAVASDSPVFGVFDGVQYYDTAQQKTIFSNSWNAPSTALAGSVLARVITDPYAVFLVQSGPTSAVVQSDIGKNAKFVAGTPQTGTGISTEYLDQATINTTATFPFRIIGFGQNLNNDVTSGNNYVEVIANPGAWNSTAGTGI
jgi:hypothetical protein